MESDLQILPIAREHIPTVCEIHAQCFPGTRTTVLGTRFLSKMYEWFVVDPQGFGIVVVRDGVVVGFVVGSLCEFEPHIFRYTLPHILSALLCRPWLLIRQADRIFNLWASPIKGLLPGYGEKKVSRPQKYQGKRYSYLAMMGVARSEQGRGTGRLCCEGFERLSRERGCEVVHLTTEASNIPARTLYDRCGWELTDENPTDVIYEKPLE